MGEEKMQIFRDPISTITGPYSAVFARKNNWAIAMNDDNNSDTISCESSSSSFGDSINSMSSTSSIDLEEDASSSNNTSSSSSSSSSSLNGPLYELSDLMAHLPIKRGLSKHFEGKSQSFTSLCNVNCIEDLAKRNQNHFGKKMKTCKSYGGGLDIHKKIISKKSNFSSKGSFVGRRISSFGSPRSSSIPPKIAFHV